MWAAPVIKERRQLYPGPGRLKDILLAELLLHSNQSVFCARYSAL